MTKCLILFYLVICGNIVLFPLESRFVPLFKFAIASVFSVNAESTSQHADLILHLELK